jgi:membrane protease subunit HflK
MSGNNGGPWGGGGRGGGDDDKGRGQRPGGSQIPEVDQIIRKGREQLNVLMGGRGGRPGGTGGDGGPGFELTRGGVGLIIGALVVLWFFMSFYTLRPEQRSVELFLGERHQVGESGLNFAPWPIVTYEVVEFSSERTEDIGGGTREAGLMLTTDANIVDIGFQVVWNISDPEKFLFNIAEPEETVRAVAEAAIREIIAESELAPILNRDRGVIAERAQEVIQEALDSYDSGIAVVRLNLERADPPAEVIDAFRAVQAAEQERDRLESQADAYANTVTAGARGEAAQILEQAEGYRARVVNEAQGEASRFLAVLAEYLNAPEVTRKRLYLETMEQILGTVPKILLDETVAGGDGGQGVVPFLPLNELRPGGSSQGGAGSTEQGGN